MNKSAKFINLWMKIEYPRLLTKYDTKIRKTKDDRVAKVSEEPAIEDEPRIRGTKTTLEKYVCV